MKNKRQLGILIAVAALLLIPFVAMRFTDEVRWTPADFFTAGILLLGTGLAFELAWRKIKKPGQRLAICGAITGVFILVWLEMAVGIFGSPLAGS